MKLVKTIAQLAICLARELSDEGGYRRYLQQSGSVHSGETWRYYIDSRYRQKFQNAKCC